MTDIDRRTDERLTTLEVEFKALNKNAVETQIEVRQTVAAVNQLTIEVRTLVASLNATQSTKKDVNATYIALASLLSGGLVWFIEHVVK
jgi:septal ring factor EnvC (AmiA/AmiB activator)